MNGVAGGQQKGRLSDLRAEFVTRPLPGTASEFQKLIDRAHGATALAPLAQMGRPRVGQNWQSGGQSSWPLGVRS